MKRNKHREAPLSTAYMSKANSLVMQGLCGYVVVFAITSEMMLESGEILFWLLTGFILAGLPYGFQTVFFPDEPQPYYYNESFTWIFISFLLKFVAACVIGLFVYPVILLSTLAKANREKKFTIQSGYSWGSPFQFFQTSEKAHTPGDYKKAIFKYVLFIILLLACMCFISAAISESSYRAFAVQGSLMLTGYVFLALSVFYYVLRVFKDFPGSIGGAIAILGFTLFYACIAVDLVCIMMISMEHILGLDQWRISEIQKLKLFYSVGLVLLVYFVLFFIGKLIYHIVRLGQLMK